MTDTPEILLQKLEQARTELARLADLLPGDFETIQQVIKETEPK